MMKIFLLLLVFTPSFRASLVPTGGRADISSRSLRGAADTDVLPGREMFFFEQNNNQFTTCTSNDDCSTLKVCGCQRLCVNRGGEGSCCEDNSHCKSGFECKSKKCAEKMTGEQQEPICSQNSDCNAGFVCKSQKCVRPPEDEEGTRCSPSTPCKKGLYCLPSIDGANELDFSDAECISPYNFFTKAYRCGRQEHACKSGLWCLPGIENGEFDFKTSKCIRPSKFFTEMCTRYRNEGLVDSPMLETPGKEVVIGENSGGGESESVCNGGTCEVCDSLDSFQYETEQCADRLASVSDFLGEAIDMLEKAEGIASDSQSIVSGIETLESIFDGVHPLTKGIPYVGSLLNAFNKAMGSLKTPLNEVASQKANLAKTKANLEIQQERIEEAETVLQNTVCTVDVSRKAVQTAKDVGCTACVQALGYDEFSSKIDPALERFADGFDGLVSPMKLCNTDLSLWLKLPQLDLDLDLLSDISDMVQKIETFFKEVRDKVIKEADMFLCCEDVGEALRSVGDLFSDLAGLVTCASDGATAGIIKESLDVVLPAFKNLLDEVNKPIDKYNRVARELNGFLFNNAFIPSIQPSFVPVIDISECVPSLATLEVERVSICGSDDNCGLPIITPLGLGDTDGQFNPEAILQEIAAQCEDSWNNVKDLEVDNCCEAARENVGLPREGLPNGESCEKWGNCNGGLIDCDFWGACKSNLCYRGTCVEPGSRNWEPCNVEKPCKGKDGFNCLVDGVCGNGQLGAPCIANGDCSKSSKYCGWNGNNEKECMQTCSKNADCSSGYCGWDGNKNQVCTSGNAGTFCDKNNQCKSGYCTWTHWSQKGECKNKMTNGNKCGDGNQCKSGYCGWDCNGNRVCTNGAKDTCCDADAQCASGNCIVYVAAKNRCK